MGVDADVYKASKAAGTGGYAPSVYPSSPSTGMPGMPPGFIQAPRLVTAAPIPSIVSSIIKPRETVMPPAPTISGSPLEKAYLSRVPLTQYEQNIVAKGGYTIPLNYPTQYQKGDLKQNLMGRLHDPLSPIKPDNV